jgi:hypothetical protein
VRSFFDIFFTVPAFYFLAVMPTANTTTINAFYSFIIVFTTPAARPEH